MSTKRTRATCLAMSLIIGLATSLAADTAFSPPDLVPYQGVLHDEGGVPLAGAVTLAFAIHETATGGTAVWSEVHTDVPLHDGVFSVLLGSLSSIGATVFDGPERWIETTVNGETLTPRRRFGSVPSALVADVADSALATVDDWSISGLDVYVNDASVGLGTNAPAADLHIARSGDATLTLEADPSNTDEGAQPSIVLTQDGGALSGHLGFFDANNDLVLRRMSPGPDTTRVTLADAGNNVDVGADLQVGGGSGSDGASELLGMRARSATWMLGVLTDPSPDDSDFFIGRNLFPDGTFHIEGDGNVGLGTASPSARLEVAGVVRSADRRAIDGAGTAPIVPGGHYEYSAVIAWAHVDSVGTISSSFGVVVENTRQSEGRYELTLLTPLIGTTGAVVVTPVSRVLRIASAVLTPGFVPRVTVGTSNGASGAEEDASFCMLVVARP